MTNSHKYSDSKIVINLNFHLSKELRKLKLNETFNKRNDQELFYPISVKNHWINGQLSNYYLTEVLELINEYDETDLIIKLHFSGTFLEILQKFYPKSLQRLKNFIHLQNNEIIFVSHTYFSSLAHIFDTQEYKEQIELQSNKLKELFGKEIKIVSGKNEPKQNQLHFNFSTHQIITPETIEDFNIDKLSDMQIEAITKLYSLSKKVLSSHNKVITDRWRNLQICDHIYYISDHWHDDEKEYINSRLNEQKDKVKQILNPFLENKTIPILNKTQNPSNLTLVTNPNKTKKLLLTLAKYEKSFSQKHSNISESPYEAFINYMNAINLLDI